MFAVETDSALREIRRTFESAGARMATFHLPSGLEDDIASFYETVRRNALKNIRLWLEKALTLGAFVGILHPTTSRMDVSLEGTDNYFSRLGKSL